MSVLPPLHENDLRHIWQHTEPIWRQLAGERLFITGGTGFFGVWLLEALVFANKQMQQDVRATILSRNPAKVFKSLPHVAGCVSWHEGDVRNFQFPDGHFSHIIHAATSVDARYNASAPADALDTMVQGTRRVLELAARAGTTNFLLTSSGAVYGPQPPDMANMSENFIGGPDPTSVGSVYAEGKRMAELQLAIAASQSDLEGKIARCYCFVGPHLPLDWHFAIGNFIRDALAGSEIVVQGDGRPMRSYLHAADLVIWLVTVLAKGQSLRPYNVGSEQACSIGELAERVARASPQSSRIRVLVPGGEGLPPRYVPDTRRAREELGLHQTIPLDEAISRTLTWWRGALHV